MIQKTKMMQQKKDIIKKSLKLSLRFSILFLFLSSCKGQDKEKTISKNPSSLIEKELAIDMFDISDNKFRSKTLDQLFQKKNGTYIIGDYSGTSKENFDCKIIGLFNNNNYEKSYALFLSKNNVLKDTLNINKKDISLGTRFENSIQNGIALGNVDSSDSQHIYFQITDLYEVDKTTIKLKKIDKNQKILSCEIPLDYLTEDYVGGKDYFSFGINPKTTSVKPLQNLPSDLKGMWAVECQNELTELDINQSEGHLSLYDFNAIYINLKVEKSSNNNEYILKFESTSFQRDYYKGMLMITNDNDISKEKPIGKLIVRKDGKAELQWTGLYNLKKQKLEFVGSDFLLIKENGGKTPLILEHCE